MSYPRTVLGAVLCMLLARAFYLAARASIPDGQSILERLLKTFYRVTINPKLITVISYLLSFNGDSTLFILLFIFRYTRLLVTMVGYRIYKPTPIPVTHLLTSRDVTVIVPTIDPFNIGFAECMSSLAANNPACIIIVTAGGHENFVQASKCQQMFPQSNILVLSSRVANKRHQTTFALAHTRTPITVLADDHVFWPRTFLPYLLAPFHNRLIGAVGTSKRVRRTCSPGTLTWSSFWNLLGILYLERHNFEIAASNALDGGVFVLSGRTVGYRTSILKDPAFVTELLSEYTCFGAIGPMNVDDDNFVTRWVVNKGWKIKIQHFPGGKATIQTTLGEYPKFLKQCVRWSRTTWRSNAKSLFTERTIYRSQPWSVYAVYITSFVNFALFYDAAMLYALSSALHLANRSQAWLIALVCWILASKGVKVAPYFWEYPQDLILLPGYILFGYFHSLIKLYALATVWNISWAGREGLEMGGKGDGDADGEWEGS